ncbi:MAG: STM4012 family radical SAM protein [Alphaproteobacteria bacterium]|nr:STM4012 family radical SAM protein [Alphaproteobacteria bacterium]
MTEGSPYAGYTYSYPHKTAYRRLPAPVPLARAWAGEDTGRLFLYAHVPFCEMRCGFCNLFTTARPEADVTAAWLDAVTRQASRTRADLEEAGGRPPAFARVAVGGGTPTWLTAAQLTRLFDLLEQGMGADLRAVPVSVEVSPGTLDAEKLAILRERGADRVSIGIQSFFDEDVRAMGRPQRRAEVERALGALRDAGFPTLNLDFIYGGATQTVARWVETLETALAWSPEEIYLYPLYVRPLTGLGRRGRGVAEDWDAHRLALYRAGRDLLRARGYQQVSMRMFRSPRSDGDAPVYRCQDDGMVGLGCGARSYTRGLHYSSEYAVSARGVREILTDYLGRTEDDFAAAVYGFALDAHEQRRRFALLSLLSEEGLSLADWAARFDEPPAEALPQLDALPALRLARWADGALRLTDAGVERSDAIGPWLYSPAVRARMDGYDLT